MTATIRWYGENTKVVRERLGHHYRSFTVDKYQHVIPGMDEAAVNVLLPGLRVPTGDRGGPGHRGRRSCAVVIRDLATGEEESRPDRVLDRRSRAAS